ncbi:hypothetical protein ACFYVL_16915 [Streptomyces sp. NPDC004111]|uniref:hypothetical protein n=1 Tax=Streptomyces sp. NPDC004111 TaxID=3364690 RepID=UPI00369BD817
MSDLEKGVGALRLFQKRVNDLLTVLENSDGGRTKLAAQRVSRASLSGGNATFAEADGLFAQYNRVHQSLTSLSKSLGDQIEALSIGVHAAEVGYDNVDEDVRRRYALIQERIEKAQDEDRERYAEYRRGVEAIRERDRAGQAPTAGTSGKDDGGAL